jgi:hypothetical protein
MAIRCFCPARQARAAGAEAGVHAVVEATDVLQHVGGGGGPLDVVGRDPRAVEGDVLGHRALEQPGLLGHERHQSAPRHRVELLVGHARDRDRAPGGQAQPQEELHEGRLAAARRPDHAQHLAGLDAEVDPVDAHPARLVVVTDVAQLDLGDALEGAVAPVLGIGP